MIPSRPLAVYLALATRILALLPRFRAARTVSEIMTLALYAAPVVLAGIAGGLIGNLAPAVTTDVPTAVVAAPFGSSSASAWALFMGVAGGLLFLVAKSAVDAVAYASLRAVVRLRADIAKRAFERIPAFLALNLLQLALAMGAAFFFAPLILRLIRLALASEDAAPLTGILVPGAIALGVFALVRVTSMFVAAWLTWRPAFIAGALGASFASPFRDARLFWSTVAVFAPFAVAAGLVMLISGLSLFLPQLEISLSPFAQRMIFIATFFMYLQVTTWFDVAIVASVGHQVGEFGLARSADEAARMRAHSVAETIATNEQQLIVAAPPGLFRAAAPQTVRFEDVLGYRPQAGDRERWAIEALQQHQASDARTTGGALEVVFRAPRAANAAANTTASTAANDATTTTSTSAGTAAATSSSLTPGPATVQNPAHTEPHLPSTIEASSSSASHEKARDLRGLARLEGSLLPSVLRTAGGSPEVRFKEDRRTDEERRPRS